MFFLLSQLLAFTCLFTGFGLAIWQAKLFFSFRCTRNGKRLLRRSMPFSLLESLTIGALREAIFFGRKLSAKYGPIYRLHSTLQPVVILASSDLVAEFYREHSRSLVRGPEVSLLGQVSETVMGKCMAALHGKEWQLCRSPFKNSFLAKAIEEHYEMIQHEIAKWQATNRVTGGTNLDVAEHKIDQLPLSILSRVVYGNDLSDEQMQQIVEFGREHIELIDSSLFPTNSLPFSRMAKRYQQFRAKWSTFNTEMLEKVRKDDPELRLLTRSDAFSIAAAHFMLQDGGLTANYDKFIDTLDEILLLNIDVTYVVLMNLLCLVASDENVQRELSNEIQQSCQGDSSNNIDFETLSQLPYLDAVLKETIRLRPPLTLSFPERTTTPMELGGYHIPAGTAVMIDADTINHDADNWPNPDRFDPSRFLDNKDLSLEFKYFKYGLNPKRKCLGFRYGEVIIKRVAWEILSSYNVKIAGTDSWLTDCRDSGVPFFTPFCKFPKLEIQPLPSKDLVVRIDDGVSLPCFVLGENALQVKGNVLFGMSFGNSYYTEDCIKLLIPFLAKKFGRVFIDVPDEWTKHTYLALGYQEGHLRRKLKYQTSRLRRYCQAGVELACQQGAAREQFIFIDWGKHVETSQVYQYALEQFRKAYNEDEDFGNDCNATTTEVLRSQGKTRGFDQKSEAEVAEAVSKAVAYVHMELAESIAFGQIAAHMTEGEVLEDTPAAMVYHRRWPVLEKLFSGKYNSDICKYLVRTYSPNFGFVIFEARPIKKSGESRTSSDSS